MPRKILFCATVDFHFQKFHLPHMQWFQQQGWEVHVAANGTMQLPYVDKQVNLPIQRSPKSMANLAAYRQLKSLIVEERYDMIHCHTPMGGVIGRLAARKARKTWGTKVIYTAHGFHFYTGAPKPNWLIYYPIEKALSKLTDSLVTINEEDYRLALDRKFKALGIHRVHGVGIDTDAYHPIHSLQRQVLRTEYQYAAEDFLLFYAAEFNKNKNQQLLIRALASMKHRMPSAKLLLAGDGVLLESCRQLAGELGVTERVDFLGYRNDIESLMKISDIAVASSYREGLPVNIMEAMACGLPIVASDNRGHRELVDDRGNGYIVPADQHELFGLRMHALYQSKELYARMSKHSERKMESYNLQQVRMELQNIYSKYMMENENEAKDKYHRAYI